MITIKSLDNRSLSVLYRL